MWLRAVSRIRDKLGDGPQARACDTSLITLKVAILPRLLRIGGAGRCVLMHAHACLLSPSAAWRTA